MCTYENGTVRILRQGKELYRAKLDIRADDFAEQWAAYREQQFLAAPNAFRFFGKTAAITAGASQDCSASSSLMLYLSFGSGKR